MNRGLTYINPNAKIGKNVIIEPFVSIHDDVEIGDDTWIGSNAVIMSGARIGKSCKIFPGAVISAIPQDLKFAGEKTYVEIGNNTTIRECVTVNRGTAARGKTIVGDNCLLMAYSHVGHDCEIGNNVILGNATQIAGEVEIDDFAILSSSVLVHQFSKIGCHVMISGQSKVKKDVPPYVMVAYDPIAYAGLNSVGLRRRQFSSEAISTISEVYRILYASNLNVKNALNEIEANIPKSKERDTIINFVKNSERGIMKGNSTTKNA